MTKTKNLPVNPTELLKKQLAEANKRVGQSDAKRIKITIAGFQDPNGTIGPTLELIVVDYTLVHSYFKDDYDADNIVPPICYANNRVFQELCPVADSPTPQAENCAVCPQNRFKSAKNKRAKACRNSRLLAVLPPAKITSAPMWTFSVAPTSTSRWDGYVKELMKHNLTPMFAVVGMAFEPVGTAYAKPIFSLIRPLTQEETTDVIGRLEEARELIDQLPDWSEDK
jgi:hypothetical protein